MGPRGPSMPLLGSAGVPDNPVEDGIKGCDTYETPGQCFSVQVKHLTSETLWSIGSWQALTWITYEAFGSFLTYR